MIYSVKCFSKIYKYANCKFWIIQCIIDYPRAWDHYSYTVVRLAASWSSGRVQDSGLGSRSSPEFNTVSVRLLVVPLSKALHAALLLSTQEEMGTCEGRFVSRGAKLRVSGCILPRELRWISKWIWSVKAQWPGKVLVKVCRAELWAWMWTQNSDFTLHQWFFLVKLIMP